MGKSVTQEIAYYCHKDTNYALTVVPKLGVNWMSRFQDCQSSILAMYTRFCNVKQPKGVVPEKVQPFYDALSTLLASNKYLPQNIHNMDKTGCAFGDVQRKKVLVHKDTGAKRAVAMQAKQL